MCPCLMSCWMWDHSLVLEQSSPLLRKTLCIILICYFEDLEWSWHMETCRLLCADFSWGVMSKYLFTPDRAWMADQRNNFIKVQLGQMILLRLLKRIGEVLLKIITRSTPRQLHHWKVYPRITPKSYSHRDACTPVLGVVLFTKLMNDTSQDV